MKSNLTLLPVVALLLMLPFAKFHRTAPSPNFAGQLTAWDGYGETMRTAAKPIETLPMLQDSAAAKKVLFIAIFSLGPSWQADKPAHEQAYFKEHSANLKKLRTEKKILVGARYSDKGMIIIAAANEQEARAMLEHDPMVANKVFNLELHQFNPFYKGCIDPQ
ncbi:MAG: YciI family protein [bacterium]